jgi:hypothetical protein
MANLYYISTRPQSRFIQDHSTVGYTPVLNETTGKGDMVHQDHESAWKLAQDLAYGLEGAKGMDVIEMQIDDAVFERLKATGDIALGKEQDMFGAPLAVLSHTACMVINNMALMEKHEYLIPEAQVQLLTGSSDYRGITTFQ